MVRPLPYPGHTWSFSQHAIGNDPKTLYDFLKCVAPFEGETEDYDKKITALMIAMGVLTANIRDDTPNAWRDYQQILAELGLIYSTKIVPALSLTELGQMFLAGEIGFSELMGAQALRYQYPNGQKSTIQGRLRDALKSAGLVFPATVTELQASQGILLKPGTLILRVLIELFQAGHAPELTTEECQAFLIPCKTNQEWPIALAEIISNRTTTPIRINQINRHARRNIQDWFKLLDKSDFFEIGGRSSIKLSAYSLSNLNWVHSICMNEEDPAYFWIPTNFDIQDRRTWFDWFGHLPYFAQSVFRLDMASDQAYLAANYVSGVEDEDAETNLPDTSEINLQPIDLVKLGRDTQFSFSGDIAALAENLRRGAQKRHAKTLLHDRIIKDLAESFTAQGAKVESDPNSIDLLSTWPNGNSAIFEVKTVTRKSLQSRLRSAIGQVEEYAYRRCQAGAGISDKVVVVNTELASSSWQTGFLTQHMSIGLICKSSHYYKAYAPATSTTQTYWMT